MGYEKRFDMRWVSQTEFAHALADAECEAAKHFGSPVTRALRSEGTQMVATFEPASEPLRMAQLAGELEKEVAKVNERNSMSLSKVKAVPDVLARLKHSLEARAEAFTKKAEAADAKGATVFERAGSHVAAAEADLEEVNQFLADAEKATNGPPASTSETP